MKLNRDNKTKIVATLGPACTNREVLKKMIEEGLNVCRLNFSHGKYEEYTEIIQTIRSISEELGSHTAILADLQGPKLRIGEVENNGVELVPGATITFTTEKCMGTAERVFMTYESFPKDVKVGERVLLDDGKLILEVTGTNKTNEVTAKVLYGGILSSKKGVNLPNTKVSLPCLTEKDLKDLDFALSHDIPWIGLSFVRSAEDIIELKHIIKEKGKNAKVVAKIEKPEAIDDIDEIIKATDAVMVARGDLGVEVPMERVPLLQKMLIEKSRFHAKPVIIATQMMESMITSPSPTRAEVNDVATAVREGADAVMLSGETSVGKYPIEVIKTMYKIVVSAETDDDIYHHAHPPKVIDERFVTDSICYSACTLAEGTDVKAIITNTFSGYTGFKLSSFRPKAWVFVFTSNHKILNMISLLWGVKGFYYDKFVSTDHTIADIKYQLRKTGFLKEGDLVINIASMPITDKGKTNMLKLSEVE